MAEMSEKARVWTADELLKCLFVLNDIAGNFCSRYRSECHHKIFRLADDLVPVLTAFKTFADLADANKNGYRPTIRVERGREYLALADFYDWYMIGIQSSARAFRG